MIRLPVRALGVAACFLFVLSAPAQEPAVPSAPAPEGTAASVNAPRPGEPLLRSDPSVLLGATLDYVVGAFGAPSSVRSSRGPEAWQDDVVFIYDTAELYWFQDRVWQVRTNAAYGLRAGDSREAVVAALGEPLRRYESDFVYQRPSRAWPLRLRVRFGENGSATDFYVYRADF